MYQSHLDQTRFMEDYFCFNIPQDPSRVLCGSLPSLANEITPVVHFIFTQSLCTGELPTEWTQVNVAPIFKKGG